MKQLIISVFLILAISASTEAAPALRGAMRVMQADGTWITVEQFGDEDHHWMTTADGVMVINSGKGYYVADIDDEGKLTATTVLVHEAGQRSANERALVSRQLQRHTLFHQRAKAPRRALGIGSGKYLPHSGSPRVLTILAAYKDLDFTVNDPVRAFDQLLNGEQQTDLGNHNQLNLGSVRKYFEGSSQNQFSPQFDIVGPITLPDSMAYYGGTNNNGSDDKFTEFCRDALAQVEKDSLVADWSLYDNDHDGTIELVCIVYAGYGQNQGGDVNTMWAKASHKNMAYNDQIKIGFFNCSCELFYPAYADYINGTGVFIHEFSHCMGLPDLYATTSSAYVNNQGMETWDIMDYGLYNYNGFAPCPYTAWEQEVLGWTEIETLTAGSQVTSLLPLIEGGKAYKFVNADNELNYIVMENIQRRGLNKKASGHGLLVYQVNYPNASVNMTDAPNNKKGFPAVAVVPAGGLLISCYLRGSGKEYTMEEWNASQACAPFPGAMDVRQLTDDMELPNYRFLGGEQRNVPQPVGYALQGITEDETSGTVSFFVSDGADGILPLYQREQLPDNGCYDLKGRRVVNPVKGLYIRHGRKVVVM